MCVANTLSNAYLLEEPKQTEIEEEMKVMVHVPA